MKAKQILVFPSANPQWPFMGVAVPLPGRKTEWFPTKPEAVHYALAEANELGMTVKHLRS